ERIDRVDLGVEHDEIGILIGGGGDAERPLDAGETGGGQAHELSAVEAMCGHGRPLMISPRRYGCAAHRRGAAAKEQLDRRTLSRNWRRDKFAADTPLPARSCQTRSNPVLLRARDPIHFVGWGRAARGSATLFGNRGRQTMLRRCLILAALVVTL